MKSSFKTISIVIPSYNSEKNIALLIKKLKKVTFPGLKKEIIVVNDCSKDGTDKILKSIKGITYIRHKRNTGKGGAVKTGLAAAKGEILYIQDDDLEYDPEDIGKVIKPILTRRADIVFGSRHLHKNNPHSSLLYYVGGFILDQVIGVILGAHVTDAITGSKGFTREVYEEIQPIESTGFEIEVEITAKAIKHKCRLKEVPIAYHPRTHAQGKNIRWHHAFPILKALFKYRFL